MIKQIRPKKIYEIVAEQLTDMIKSGHVKPGDRLSSVQQLAEEFNVGRSAIREALSALNAMGLIEIKQGEGTFVKKFDLNVANNIIPTILEKEDVVQLFAIRKFNETGAASLAASNRTIEDLERIEAILAKMANWKVTEGLGEKVDMEFHMAIVKASKNEMLYKLLLTISETIQQSMRETRQFLLYSTEEKLKRLYDEHYHIYIAIKNQNPQEAYDKTLQHIVSLEKALFEEE